MFRRLVNILEISQLKFAVAALTALTLGCLNSGCGALVSRATLYPDYLSGDAASRAADAVRQKFGEKARVLEVDISRDTFEVKVQDASNPQNVDLYKYNGVFLMKTAAVRLDGLERNLKSTLFDFAAIDFDAIPRLANAIQERAKFDNGQITKIEIRRKLNLAGDFENSGDVRWYVQFADEREQVSAVADAAGNLVSVDLRNTAQALDFDLSEPDELKRAVETIRAAFDAKSPVLKIVLDSKYLTVKKPDADDPDLIYDYHYNINGLRKDYTPPATKSVIDHYFSLDEINLEDAPRLSRIALEKFSIPQAHVDGIEIRKIEDMKTETYPTVWRITVKPQPGPGGKSGYVEFDAAGNFREIYRWK